MNKQELESRIRELQDERAELVQEDLTAQAAVRDCSYGQASMRDVTECERTCLNLNLWDDENLEELTALKLEFKTRFGNPREPLHQRV